MNWSVPCRTCGQVGYTPCLTPSGNRRRDNHVVRTRDNSTRTASSK
jgi:glycine cleavage system aminomethyltransferase T